MIECEDSRQISVMIRRRKPSPPSKQKEETMQHWKRNTSFFLGGQVVSLFGSALVQYAITWHITLVTQSGFYMTLAIICGFLPTFFLAPFAGVWADRYDRKKLIILSDGSIAITTLILALAIYFGYDQLWIIYVAMGIRALGGAVQMPCVGAILPSIVPEEHLTRVNGINGTLQSVIMLVAPMLAALLLKTAPFYSIFFIDVVTAMIGIGILLVLFRLPPMERRLGEEPSDYFGELRRGISYVARAPYLRNLFLILGGFYLLFAPVAFLTPLQVTRNYGDDAFYLMAIEVAFSVGMAAGGILIASWGGFRNKIHSIGVASVAMGVCTLVLGLPIPLWFYLGLMGLFGVAMPICSTPSMVLLQERVDPEYLGRVFGVMTMISSSLMPLGMLFFGPLADVVAIEWLLLSTGAAMFILSFVLMSNKPLLIAGAPKIPPPEEPQEGQGTGDTGETAENPPLDAN